ncbi:DUF302 domain-containing protein [Nocardia sp. alder85J]|uniref:DUF302 domain-containing protein n=1 Tax=Nocardia sp. alder85J TaxID=2862949 RepID=UPI001CD2011D|nr:DUF302 domain-containing protein [Nocardia sp. alder85J]MCX4099060.1 DUF302 domain-containing protein [Nocardia sp. alder85J]
MTIIRKTAPGTVAATVERLLALLAERGVTVFAVIDQAAAARGAGLTLRDTVLVVFGDPRAGTPVMAAVPAAALDLPLSVLIWDDAGRTEVAYRDPVRTAAGHGVPADLAARLGAVDVLTDILATDVSPTP